MSSYPAILFKHLSYFSTGLISCSCFLDSSFLDISINGGVDSIFEYNRLHELLDTVRYYNKLLSQYGYNAKKNEWNLKRFPITQNDKQMDGIKADIKKFGIAADEYNGHSIWMSIDCCSLTLPPASMATIRKLNIPFLP